MEKNSFLHVVAFNVPYPPNYGGIIDIYYKLKALHEQGQKIILHSFTYGREETDALKDVCDQLYFYPRKRGLHYFFHRYPYIVATRQHKDLEKNLLGDTYPVLFEGLHTTFLLNKCKNAGKKTLVRTHNIEHNYYKMLARSERNIFRKIFFYAEAGKLKKYEEILKKADQLLSISSTDTKYFNEKYKNSIHVSAFHQHTEVDGKAGKGAHILFHGNLSVPENEQALMYLLSNVLSKVPYKVIIAGKDPGKYVIRKCESFPNIELISNPDDLNMNRLVAGAHINLLYTYQPTGLKLKLLHSLYGGRFCLANPLMLSGSGLEELCEIYRSPAEAIKVIENLMSRDFTTEEIEKRKKALNEYHNSFNAVKIIEVLK